MMIENLLRKNIQRLKAYSSARDDFKGEANIYLDANESPFENGLNRYPDPYQSELKIAIAKWKSINSENIVLGNGSDEIIDLVFRSFCEPLIDNVVLIKPSYGMYEVLAQINNIEINEVELNKDFSLNSNKILEKVNDKTKLLIICSPNNPSSNVFDEREIENLLHNFKGIVFIDEAYIDFSESESWLTRLENFPRLIVSQTFSKGLGYAGIRLGMMFASKEICSIINKVKAPYNVNTLTQNKALEILEKKEFVAQINDIKKEKEKLEKHLKTISLVEKIFPSDANFLLVKVKDASLLYKKLAEDGIIVRNRSNMLHCENSIRISVGTNEENENLIKTLKKIEAAI